MCVAFSFGSRIRTGLTSRMVPDGIFWEAKTARPVVVVILVSTGVGCECYDVRALSGWSTFCCVADDVQVWKTFQLNYALN